jgi:hypothetical protein
MIIPRASSIGLIIEIRVRVKTLRPATNNKGITRITLTIKLLIRHRDKINNRTLCKSELISLNLHSPHRQKECENGITKVEKPIKLPKITYTISS